MKVVLGGAFGNLGADVLKTLLKEGHEVVAADIAERDVGVTGYKFKKINATDPQTLKGICDGADAVITTIGLTKASATLSAYDIDYKGNLNLLNEAKAAGVKNFAFVSVIKADKAPHIPMLHAKAMFEEELKKSGLQYVIYRPTGYFYDIIKVFKPMIEKGTVNLLKTKQPIRCNVISTEDFAEFIVAHMCDENKSYNVGGKETYTYEELAKLCFNAAGKEPIIKFAPAFLFDVLAFISKCKKDGREGVIRFGQWTMTEEMVGDTVYGNMSFAQYIKDSFKG